MPLLPHCSFAVLANVISSPWHWRKDCQGLFHLRRSSKTGSARERQSSRIWQSGGKGRVDLSRPKNQILWPMRTADGVESWHFWRRGCLLPQHFVEGTVTKHRQLRLPYLGGNWFGNGNEKVSEPSKLIWSSNSLCPWINKGCYGL